jgi:hypothetical protein
LEGIEYRGKNIVIIYDRKGGRYTTKPGLSVLIDGKLAVHNKKLDKLTINKDQL